MRVFVRGAAESAEMVESKPGGRWLPTYVRFVLVGVFNTAFGFGLYLAFLWAGLPYPAALALSLFIGLLVGFLLGQRLVFSPTRPWRFIVYCAAWGLVYLLNLAGIAILMPLGVPVEFAPLFVLPINVVLSYVLQKYLVYR